MEEQIIEIKQFGFPVLGKVCSAATYQGKYSLAFNSSHPNAVLVGPGLSNYVANATHATKRQLYQWMEEICESFYNLPDQYE